MPRQPKSQSRPDTKNNSMADYEKMRQKLQAPILDVFDSDKQSNSARNSEKSESQKSIKGVKKKVNIELSEEQHNMLMKHMSKD